MEEQEMKSDTEILNEDEQDPSQMNPLASQKMPISFRQSQYVSDEMQNFLELDCPEEISPPGLENIHYSNASLFPEWLLATSEWKKTKVNTSASNAISDILQIPQAQRSIDQISTLVKWLMDVWDTAKSMGFSKCVAMFKEFKYFRHEAGENIITEGERGLTFYIIISGETVIHKEGLGVVATLGKGKSFGEIALAGKDLRTATVRAVTPVEVLRLHKVDYDHFVRDIQHAERREHYHLLRECHLFDSWNRARVDRIANTCKRRVFEKGTYIFRQGDDPDFVYIVLEGCVDIIKEVQIVCKNRWPSGVHEWTGCAKSFKKSFVMSTINTRGAFFGELSILRDDKRSASCLATARSTLVAIDRLEFLHMMEPGKQAEFQANDLGVNDSEILQRVGHITGGPSSFARSGTQEVMPNIVVKKKSPKKEKRVTIAPEPVILPQPAAPAAEPRKSVVAVNSLSLLAALAPGSKSGPNSPAAINESSNAIESPPKKAVSHLKHLGEFRSVGFSSHKYHHSGHLHAHLHAHTEAARAGSPTLGHGDIPNRRHGTQSYSEIVDGPLPDPNQLPPAFPLYRSGSPPREDGASSALIFGSVSRSPGNPRAPRIAPDDTQPLKALVTNMQEYTPTGRLANNSMMLNVDDVRSHIEAHSEWRTSPVAQGIRSKSARASSTSSNSLVPSQSQSQFTSQPGSKFQSSLSVSTASVNADLGHIRPPPKTAPAVHAPHQNNSLFVRATVHHQGSQTVPHKPKLSYRDVMSGDWSNM